SIPALPSLAEFYSLLVGNGCRARHHVECGGLPPLFAVRACPDVLQPASSQRKTSPIANVPSKTTLPSWIYLRRALKNSSRAHPPADAHRDQPIARFPPLHLAQNSRRQLRSCAAERVPQRHRTAIHIHAPRVQSRKFDHRQRLRRKRLIQFDHVDLIQRQSRNLQRLRDRVHRPHTHFFGRTSGRSKRHKPYQWLQSQCTRAFATHHHGGRRRITHL